MGRLAILATTVTVAVGLADCGTGSTMWDDAEVGDNTRVCGWVRSVGHDGDDSFLNLGRDYPDPDRFVIVVCDEPGLELPYGDRTRVCVEGEGTEYEGVPQIEVWNSSRIDFSDEADIPPDCYDAC